MAIQGIIADVSNPSELITFNSFEPPQRSRSPVYDDVTVRGRSEPHPFYSHTDAGVWQLSISLVASYSQGDNGTAISAKEKSNFIESMIMPDYGSSAGENAVVDAPHLARIQILKLLDAIGTIRSPSWTFLPPYDAVTGFSQLINVSFSFHEQRSYGQEPLGFAEIRRLLARGQDRQ